MEQTTYLESIDVLPDEMNSFYSSEFTFQYDKYSCVRGFYFAHIVFCYFIMITGFGAFITRLVPAQYKWLHIWFGRGYIISMLWSTATSLLIHNTGLPLAVLVSFLWVLGGMSIGWFVINIHQIRMYNAATKLVQEKIEEHGTIHGDLASMINRAKGDIITKRTVWQRFLSLKAAHGVIMFISWINIVGRIFASNQSGDFTCHTYPVYKPINTKEFAGMENNVTLVPIRNENADKLPWRNGVVSWGAMLLFGPMFGAALFGFIYSYYASRKAASLTPKTVRKSSSSSLTSTSGSSSSSFPAANA